MQTRLTTHPRSRLTNSTGGWLIIGPLGFMLIISLYFLLRYQGLWTENDSATFNGYITDTLDQGRISTAEGSYPNGYGFQAISAFLLAATGLDLTTLQQIVYPLLALVVVFPAWLLYREITGSPRGATLGTIMLIIQPEFLFVILRSTHEKFTRALLLLCLYWLIRSFKLRDRPWQFAIHIALFYLSGYAMIACNNLISNSFIFAIVTALGLGWLLAVWRPHLRPVGSHTLQRLFYTTVICGGLVFIFTFYAYTPATHDLLVLRSLGERIAALFLDVQKNNPTTSSYTQVAGAWVNLPVYFLVSLANWLVLGGSLIIWLRQGRQWLIRRATPPDRIAWLVWLLYAAFVSQGVLSILSDLSGYIGNLQVRIFPSFSTIGVGLIAAYLVRRKPSVRRLALPKLVGTVAVVGCLAVFSIFKATNEPLVSNKWIFYRPEEMSALNWADTRMQDMDIWTEYDERLITAFYTLNPDTRNNNRITGFAVRPTIRALVVSDLSRLRMSRMGQPVPVPLDALQVYDNGKAQVYRFRLISPFQ